MLFYPTRLIQQSPPTLKILISFLFAMMYSASMRIEKGRVIQKMGLSIEVSGNNKIYTYKNILEPLIGYTRKIESQNMHAC